MYLEICFSYKSLLCKVNILTNQHSGKIRREFNKHGMYNDFWTKKGH